MPALSTLHGATSTILSNLFINLPLPQPTPHLPHQTMIVTGANTGLGLETSRHLLHNGLGKLIMAVRNLEKGHAARQELVLEGVRRGGDREREEGRIEVWHLDMDSAKSVQAFAARCGGLGRVDGVLANAGIMTGTFRYKKRTQAFEQTLTVNVLHTMLLAVLLLPVLRASYARTGYAPRFVVPNSALHYLAPLGDGSESDTPILTRLNNPDLSLMSGRYPLSKLLVLYAVRELASRTSQTDLPVIINTPNPSYCVSGLARERAGNAAERTAEKWIARSTEEGSRTLYHGLVVAGGESHGGYLTNCHVQEPACHVTNQWGQKVQKQFFEELLATLEKIQPGISANI
ncbi:uncharacterized protein C8A04DRAFT_15251 [Dichotomopilus funicola]|uniref:Uncharacterized protein n=1 Tax=Dichotomopilus funicola TaxID=1934379 RepID=A0AAN6UVR2_9PEZI|nr:hypothetical protein C8A04DRAFT_15251 [Dichotomopilus funicola]